MIDNTVQARAVQVSGATVYLLNADGVNRWVAQVQPGRTDDDQRVTDEECEAVAQRIAAALTAPAAVDGWQDLPKLPEPQMPVLLDIGKKYPIRAMWVEAKTLPAGGDDDGFGEYDEADDEWYCPAGWYEWNEHEERHWSVSAKPLRWMALPAPGAAPSATAPADHSVDVLARDIRQQLGYAEWRNFEVLIQRCRGLIAQGVAHGKITQCSRSAPIGSGAVREVVDYRLDAQAYELVKAMASSFKLNGHYLVRNESATLNLVQKWAQRAGHETTPQGRVGNFVFDLLIGQSIAIEFDEPHHGSARQSATDRQKDVEAARADLTVFRFGLESDAIDIIGAIESANKMVPAAPVVEPGAQAGREADSERLEWIIRQGEDFGCGVIVDAPGDGDYMVVGMGGATGQGKTAREAIDAARATQGDRNV